MSAAPQRRLTRWFYWLCLAVWGAAIVVVVGVVLLSYWRNAGGVTVVVIVVSVVLLEYWRRSG